MNSSKNQPNPNSLQGNKLKFKMNKNLMCSCGKLQIEHEDVKYLIREGVIELEENKK